MSYTSECLTIALGIDPLHTGSYLYTQISELQEMREIATILNFTGIEPSVNLVAYLVGACHLKLQALSRAHTKNR